mmetsp:Transcript_32572/g.78249  ORF Transcript_32572/g.78249 Transcript_32572/m.78249 type:complete len:237 (+) Transcript_32572:4131-4841(+)
MKPLLSTPLMPTTIGSGPCIEGAPASTTGVSAKLWVNACVAVLEVALKPKLMTVDSKFLTFGESGCNGFEARFSTLPAVEHFEKVIPAYSKGNAQVCSAIVHCSVVNEGSWSACLTYGVSPVVSTLELVVFTKVLAVLERNWTNAALVEAWCTHCDPTSAATQDLSTVHIARHWLLGTSPRSKDEVPDGKAAADFMLPLMPIVFLYVAIERSPFKTRSSSSTKPDQCLHSLAVPET